MQLCEKPEAQKDSMLWVTIFSALSQKISGIEANKLIILERENAISAIEKIFDTVKSTAYVFRIRKDANSAEDGNVCTILD